ncbi:MAG: hypothetical protein NC213_10445 [Acetobacter sp.]|nr:hypothetical protein [Bacteroides sp.]MCM1342154.1 hypothetical protein [Acetobacter sp.]MCM1434382.1 hypothetical protein [Clostridiales bacterium]
MNINPLMLMQMKGEIDSFKSRHPKLELFFADAVNRIDTDSVLEISVTSPQGNKIRTNIKITPEDKALLEKLGSMLNNNN